MMHRPLTSDSDDGKNRVHSYVPSTHVLTKVFPFYLAFNRELKLVQVGDALQRLYPELVIGRSLLRDFRLLAPATEVDFDIIQQVAVHPFLLEHKGDSRRFQGQMLVVEEMATIFFLGTPWLEQVDSLRSLGLKLSDLTLRDTLSDFLFLLEARSTTLSGTMQLAEKLTEQRLELQRALQQAELAMTVLEQAAEAIEITDADARLLYVNSAFEKNTGYRREEVLGKTIDSLFRSGQHEQEFYDKIWQIVSGGQVWQGSLIGRRKDATYYYQDATIFPVLDRQGTITNYVAIKRDVSDRRYTQTRLEHSLALLQATFEAVADGILVVDVRGKITNFNQKFIDLWQIPPSILTSGDNRQVTNHIASRLKDPRNFSLKKLLELYVRPHFESHDLLELKDGRIFERYASPQRLDDTVIGWVWSFRDVTERQQAEAKIRQQALFDAVTGLPNRILFSDRLSVALLNTKRNLSQLAVMFLDLDHFKRVNDTLGHAAGDQLLRGVAKRLNSCLREGDTVARWAGDEFTILLPSIQHTDNATTIAQRILDSLHGKFLLDGQPVQIGSSIGIAFYPTDGKDAETLLKNADEALYLAKGKGRNNYQLYSAVSGGAK